MTKQRRRTDVADARVQAGETTRAGARDADQDRTGWAVGSGFAAATGAGRWLTGLGVLAALVLPWVLPDSGVLRLQGEPAVVVLLVGLAGLNIELGRWVEGRVRAGQRPHKTLSVWAFATVLSVDPAWLLVVVPVIYTHAWLRGMRVPLWKWAGSAAFVVLSGAAAAAILAGWPPGFALDPDAGWAAVGVLTAAMVGFLGAESVLFWAVAYLNTAADEAWLRATLRSWDFYRTELVVLALGGLSVLVIAQLTVFTPLLLAMFVVVQQAVVFTPLRQEARTDAKTGLLRYEPWRAEAAAAREKWCAAGRSWALMFIDLDHFKAFNDTHGHVAGDVALQQVARTLTDQLRPDDLLCRFGGEEFAALVAAEPDDAARLGDRLRKAVAASGLGSTSGTTNVTVSIGVATVTCGPEDPHPPELAQVLMAADRALYDAKRAGRNRVIAAPVGAH